MVIATRDQLINAMANNSSRININKASISNAVVGQFHSLWRASGQPGPGAIPTGLVVCDDELLGGMPFAQQTTPATSYLTALGGLNAVAGSTLELHDRLVHKGGLVGNVATAQTVAIDMSTLLGTANLDARKGSADYSDVQWWVEWHENTGSTAVNLTVNVKYDDGSDGDLTVVALGATRRLSFMQPLNNLIPAGAAGRYIRGVNSITLSATTGAAGSIGITATRYRAALYMPLANALWTADWAGLGLPEIANDSCLFVIMIAGASTTGNVRAAGKISHG